MAASRRVVTYAGAVSEALKRHFESRDGAKRSLDSLLPGERVRIFDSADDRQVNIEAAVDYFRQTVGIDFEKNMTGKKLIKADIKSVTKLLEMINHAAEDFIFRDMVISQELEKIADQVMRDQCRRDLVVAFTNTALGKVNTIAATDLVPDTAAYLNASVFRAFCLAVTNCNNMSPEDALVVIQKGARTVIKDGMLRQLGIVKNDDGSLRMPADIAGRIHLFEYSELLKNGVVAKNIPLLQDGSTKAIKYIMRDVMVLVHRELKKQDMEQANQFYDQCDKKARSYIDEQSSIRFASQSGSTQGVFGMSAAARASALVPAHSYSYTAADAAKSAVDDHDSPRSHARRISASRKSSLFAGKDGVADIQRLEEDKRPMQRVDSRTMITKKTHK